MLHAEYGIAYDSGRVGAAITAIGEQVWGLGPQQPQPPCSLRRLFCLTLHSSAAYDARRFRLYEDQNKNQNRSPV